MEEKYAWPLVGVALGWLLTFLATGLKDRGDRRRRVGRLLSKLIQIRDQVNLLISITADFKDHAEDLEAYERYRKGMSDRYFLEPESQIESLNAAIDDVSGDYPFEALKLRGLIDVLLKSKKTSLSESSRSGELYARLISLHEVTLYLCEENFRERIKRLAFMHGLLTFIKVQYLFSQRRKIRSGNAAFFKKVSDQAFSEMEKVVRD